MKRDRTTCKEKTKALISCAVTAHLICVFAFCTADLHVFLHNADCCFYSAAAKMSHLIKYNVLNLMSALPEVINVCKVHHIIL